MPMAKILIVGGPGDYQEAGAILRKGGHDPVSATSMKAGIEQAKKLPFGSLILANYRELATRIAMKLQSLSLHCVKLESIIL